MDHKREVIRQLVIALDNINETYSANIKKMGMKESELCLLYALGDGMPHSQKQIYEEWMIPKTTLNTITKQWEESGYLTLRQIPGKRREMQICLTESGKEYVDQQLAVIYQAEEAALEMTLERYSEEFVDAIQHFGGCLKQSFEDQFKREEIRIDL